MAIELRFTSDEITDFNTRVTLTQSDNNPSTDYSHIKECRGLVVQGGMHISFTYTITQLNEDPLPDITDQEGSYRFTIEKQ